MRKFFRSWLTYAKQHPEAEESIAHLASSYQMGRRKDLRIHYPHWGDLDYLPQVVIKGESVKVHNISVSGLGLVSKHSESSGHIIDIQLNWPSEGLTFHTKAKAIANYKHNTHMQLKNTHFQLKKKLQSCLLPHLAGERFQLVRLTDTPFRCIEEEVWISPKSETLLIQKGFGLFRMTHKEIHVEINQGVFLNISQKRQPLKDTKQLAQLLICLASIHKPTRHLIALQNYIHDYREGIKR